MVFNNDATNDLLLVIRLFSHLSPFTDETGNYNKQV